MNDLAEHALVRRAARPQARSAKHKSAKEKNRRGLTRTNADGSVINSSSFTHGRACPCWSVFVRGEFFGHWAGEAAR